MTNNEYIELLVNTFEICKEIIKKGEREIILSFEKRDDYVKKIPEFGKFKSFTIYSVYIKGLSINKYVHLSGVNILFYLVCIYLKLSYNNKGIYYKYKNLEKKEREKEKLNILKNNVFIYEDEEDGFWYYPINTLKNQNKFVFDLPVVQQTMKRKLF